MNHSQNPS